ncbi:MAG: transglycosylase SLT domain-containing protein [Legionellaceae bacterium]|nr:transglycosylase SLT domain-containing protein [Legionellaceae bacterium]
MKIITRIILCAIFIASYSITAWSDEAYLNKFLAYQKWSEELPDTANVDFLKFVEVQTPLTKKLREKWLYKLAREQNWSTYNKYYMPSDDVDLQCYALTARLHTESKEKVLPDIKKLWLVGHSQPKACDDVFKELLKDQSTNNQLINQRASLALKANNYSLANYLLKQSKPSQNKELLYLNLIHSNPRKVTILNKSTLHGDFYLYGLKKLTRKNPERALKLWNNSHAKKTMNSEQQQEFLVYFALYKALRNKDDATVWLDKVEKKYYTESLVDWEMRYAIAHKKWPQLIDLITASKNKDEIRQQYWLARAYEAIGNKSKSQEIYQEISKKRNYYGFLASNKLQQKLSLEEEIVIQNKNTLATYKPIIELIEQLHNDKKTLAASRLINDFSSELNKTERSALAYWVAKKLNWNGKSVYLCNNKALFNQLSLRFPLAHKKIVHENSRSHHISTPLIYAVIRQESAFFEKVTSSAGANGLMQIMPATAKQVARKSKISYSSPQELYLPNKNINIGVAYLQELANKFDDNPILMVAAYNAGPRQVNRWLKSNPPEDMDIWIETIPWGETRNYVKNVIAFYAVYQYRLYNKSSLDEFARYF